MSGDLLMFSIFVFYRLFDMLLIRGRLSFYVDVIMDSIVDRSVFPFLYSPALLFIPSFGVHVHVLRTFRTVPESECLGCARVLLCGRPAHVSADLAPVAGCQ